MTQAWRKNHKALLTVRTVEEFWSFYHHLTLASNLPAGTDYSFFKVNVSKNCNSNHNQEGIAPDWEDERNAGGGRWILGGRYLLKLYCVLCTHFV